MKNKILRNLIVAGMSASALLPILAVSGNDVYAFTGGKTAANAITWVKSKVGTGIDFDKMYGNQCVDLIKAYYNYLGQSQPRGNGADYAYNTLPSGWKRYKGVQPQKGDVLVYTGGYGGYGHVAIYESDYSTYHQNFNSHSYVERVTCKYNGNMGVTYWGVIRPDFVSGNASSATSQSKTTSTFTGVKYYNGVWTYVKNDKPDYSFTGVAKSTSGNWVFVNKGRYDTTFTGVAKSTGGNWVFVKKGRYNTSFTGVAKATSGNWVFVKKGRYDTSFTGVAKTTNGNWVFVKNGRYDTTFTGVAKSTSGYWVFVRNGRYSVKFTGVAKSTTGNWVYVKAGRYNTSFTGIAPVVNSNKKYYVVKGRWNNKYTGKYGTYNIKNGVVV